MWDEAIFSPQVIIFILFIVFKRQKFFKSNWEISKLLFVCFVDLIEIN